MAKDAGILRKRPKPYQLQEQHALVQEANEFCGIKKGISRADLVDKMRNCIPEFYKLRREEEGIE